MADNDPLFYLKGLGRDRLMALAKAEGFKDDEDEDDEDGEGLEKGLIDEDALLKSIRNVEEAQAAEVPRVDPGALFEAPAVEADLVDATGLLKSLVEAQRDAGEGLAASIDEYGSRLDVSQTLAQATGHATLRLAKSVQGLTEAQGEMNDLLRQLLDVTGQPGVVTSRTTPPAAMQKSALTLGFNSAHLPGGRPQPVPRFASEVPTSAPQGGNGGHVTRGRAVKALMKGVSRAKADADLGRIHELTEYMSVIETGGAMTDDIAQAIAENLKTG